MGPTMRTTSGVDDDDAVTDRPTSSSSTTTTAEDEFATSPLVEYAISTDYDDDDDAVVVVGGGGRRKDDREEEEGRTRSLAPSGPRLLPSAGLNAMYSLQFYRSRHDDDDDDDDRLPAWVAGAGKSGIVALWNRSAGRTADGDDDDDNGEDPGRRRQRRADPVISWKGHGGRWIADARFLPPPPDGGERSASSSSSSSSYAPSRLLTAGNDGTVCHWDLTRASVRTCAPRLLGQSDKALHASGIFSMDVRLSTSSSSGDVRIVTGSKDKTIAVSTICRLDDRPLWRSDFHSAKVGSVCFSSSLGNPLIASASDDGLVAVHDARLDGMSGGRRQRRGG